VKRTEFHAALLFSCCCCFGRNGSRGQRVL